MQVKRSVAKAKKSAASMERYAILFYKKDYLDNISQIYINYRSWFFIRLGFIRHGSDPFESLQSMQIMNTE